MSVPLFTTITTMEEGLQLQTHPVLASHVFRIQGLFFLATLTQKSVVLSPTEETLATYKDLPTNIQYLLL